MKKWGPRGVEEEGGSGGEWVVVVVGGGVVNPMYLISFAVSESSRG